MESDPVLYPESADDIRKQMKAEQEVMNKKRLHLLNTIRLVD